MSSLTCALGPDAAGTVLMRELRGARHGVDAAIYEVGPSYRWALVRAADRGVAVRVVLDAHRSDGNAATARALLASGAECRVAGVGAEAAHGKLLIVDSTVAVGTGNLIWRDAPRDSHLRFPPRGEPLAGTREWWVLATGSRRLRLAAADAFTAHWTTATAPPEQWATAPELGAPSIGMPMPQVAPRNFCIASRRLSLVVGGAAVGQALALALGSARRRILVTVPYARPAVAPVRALLELMSTASAGGVTCALLLGGVPDAGDAALLAALPFAVRRMDPARSTSGHAKGLVADGSVIVSSANWSDSGLGANWEAALHVDHPGAAAYYAAAWRRDWETGLPIKV
jgi:phosphatidylserine/phosphatidylglycerophosphate/cardiolipin synthase-like enzyme